MKKGFTVTGVLYSIVLLFVLLLIGILSNIEGRRQLLGSMKDDLILQMQHGLIETEVTCFIFDKETKTITGYRDDCPKEIVIPKQIEGIDVVNIGNNAFSLKQLTSVVIPNGVVNIDDHAFDSNQLTSIIIPNSVTSIGKSAFASNQLTSVMISNSVTSIAMNTFAYNQLTNIVIPNSVTSIETSAFYSNQLTNIVIPNSVTSIETSAFYSNQLTNIVIPNSVTSIGHRAFANNKLISVKIIGKASSSDFTSYGTDIWGFASGYNESCITWNASE